MAIALLQISDIHLQEGDNPVLDRIQGIAVALRTLQAGISAAYLLMPGDIAYSGKPAEYQIASSLVTELLASIEREFPGSNPQVVFAPGNRDVPFPFQHSPGTPFLENMCIKIVAAPEMAEEVLRKVNWQQLNDSLTK